MSQSIENLGTLSSTIFCGAHCCQLAAFDVEKTFTDDVAKVRQFAKESRKIKYKESFNDFPLPVLDNDTRWSSTYLMLESVFNNKANYIGIANENLRKMAQKLPWKFIEEFRETFSIIYNSTKIFQKADLTIGRLL